MNTNAALIVPPQSAATNQSAALNFHDTVKPLIDIANPWFWVWCGVILLAVAGGAFLLWWYLKKKSALVAAPQIIPPHIRARRKLEQALELIGEPKPFSSAVSDTLRIYLEERFNFHAPDRTTEEFLYELQSTNLLTPEQKQSLADFLGNCDLIKFAKYEPTETELRALHSSAMRLVNETEPREISAAIGSSISPPPPPIPNNEPPIASNQAPTSESQSADVKPESALK